MQIGQVAPDFEQDTANGSIQLYAWLGGSWGMLFSHIHDFSPVCTTELAEVARLKPEWARRDVKPIGLSTDTADTHLRWGRDIELAQGQPLNFPLIADSDGTVAGLYGLLATRPGRRWTTRSVVIIDPTKHVRAVLTYPQAVGRNFAEILRIVDALQLADACAVETPANWQDGDPVLIDAALPDGDARRRFPGGWSAPVPYFRLVTQPPRARTGHGARPERPATAAMSAWAAVPDAEELAQNRERIAGQITRLAWRDGAFRQEMLADANAVYKRVTGHEVPHGITLRVLEDDARTIHFIVPAKPANAHEMSDEELEAAANRAGSKADAGYPAAMPARTNLMGGVERQAHRSIGPQHR